MSDTLRDALAFAALVACCLLAGYVGAQVALHLALQHP